MVKRYRRNAALFTMVCLLFGSSPWVRGDAVSHFSDWSAPASLGPVVNTLANDAGQTISKDGLSLYFVSNRPGSLGAGDLWVSQRARVDDVWGPGQNLGPTVNSVSTEQTPTLSVDGHLLFFTSNRAGTGNCRAVTTSTCPDGTTSGMTSDGRLP